MKKIWNLLRTHWNNDFRWPMYVSIAIFLASGIAMNYAINLENGIIDRDTGKPIRILWYFLLYGAAYYTGSLITFFFTSNLCHFRSVRYWALTSFGLIILSCNVGFPYLSALAKPFVHHYSLFVWAYKVIANLINFLTTALPLFIFALLVEQKREYFGVNRNKIDLKPYWELLLILVPLITFASFETGFRNYYPMYKSNTAAEVMGWPSFLPPLIYELAYGLDFFNIEFIFRGFLVIGVSQLIGKDAILPMVCAYCFLHFGKPIGESISSIFGGYILGVVAFYTRNIWGGVIVHIGLAWMMELAAFLQHARN